MRASTWLMLIPAVLAVGCVLSMEPGGGARAEPPTPGSAAVADELSIGPAQRFKNLTIFPVISRGKCDADNYITLDEGLLSGKVKVFEIGATAGTATPRANPQARQEPNADPFEAPPGTPAAPAANGTLTVDQVQGGTFNLSGQVNRLVVSNESGKPLYLMPGETITGGKQDRTLAQALVVASDGKPVEVNVFCVEHGRWALRDEKQTSELATSLYGAKIDAATASELSKKAAAGQLVLGGTTVLGGIRREVNQGTTQSKVWNGVAQTNVLSGNVSASGAYTANFTSKEVTDKFQPCIAALEKPVADLERIVGVVVAVDGQIKLADVFESTPLFRKLWPKLLKGYALDALVSANPDEKACAESEALAFLHQAQTAGVEKSQPHPGVIVVTRSSDRVTSFSTSPASPQDAMKPVHTATFAK